MTDLVCGCGYVFDDALGEYGCPNCEGDEGPAVPVDLVPNDTLDAVDKTRV